MNGGVHVRDAYRGGGVCLLLGVRHIHLCWSGDRDNAHCRFGFCSLEGHVPHQWQFSKEGAVGEQVENNAIDCELSDGTHMVHTDIMAYYLNALVFCVWSVRNLSTS